MTTEPFTTSGRGDFTNPLTVQPHDCNVSVLDAVPSDHSHLEDLPQANFERCEWHGTCCVNWIKFVYCKNRRGGRGNYHCSNLTRCHEYYPITDAMTTYPYAGQYPTSWVNELPSFPLELLYTREQRTDADCERIKVLRESFCDMATVVFTNKRNLTDSMNIAWDQLCDVQQALDDGAFRVLGLIGLEVVKAIELVDNSRKQMNKLLSYTREAMRLYHDLQLTLNCPEYRRYDGDHSTSLGVLNPNTFEDGPRSLKMVFGAFEGPLKEIQELFDGCKRMKVIQQQLRAYQFSNYQGHNY